MKHREKILTTSDIRCSEEFINHTDHISVLWESSLNTEQYFGIILQPNEYLEFETKYYPFDKSIEASYTILAETPDDYEAFIDSKEWNFTDTEREFIIHKMNEFCFQEYGCTLDDYCLFLNQIKTI